VWLWGGGRDDKNEGEGSFMEGALAENERGGYF
jgi:hypothetical protein